MPQHSGFHHSGLPHADCNTNALDLLWFDDSDQPFAPSELPSDKQLRNADCISIRSSSSDPDALAVGIQAGSNENSGEHRHLDLGSFVLDALGERWILDVGTEPEIGQRQAWEYYRVRAEGHNLPTLNPNEGPDQKLDARAPIDLFESTPTRATAVVDLADAYAGHVSKATRTFEMVDRQLVTLADEIEEGWPIVNFWWFLHTAAEIEIDDLLTTATLTQNGKKLIVAIERGPSRADFEIRDAVPLEDSPHPEQSDNPGVRKLAIHLSNITQFKVEVSFTPVCEG
jgi:hypothetical protein